jgi:L-ascorbate metabolism protein UlaG (beta-lactamase superfamily)
MSKIWLVIMGLLMFMGLLVFNVGVAVAQDQFEVDTLNTSAGEVQITFIGHSSLIFAWNGKIIHTDPYSKVADYTKLPKADLILITHEHADHLDANALEPIRTEKTVVIVTETVSQKVQGGIVMKNGDTQTLEGFPPIEAVPAYNIINKRDNGQPYHPQGVGNGYILTFGDKQIYVAGDTENTPEMKALQKIDVAFLPMNLPFTMTPDMVADAAKAFKPVILYPYHLGETDASKLVELLKSAKGIEVRIRKMK